MATTSSHLLQVLSFRRVHNALPTSTKTHAYKPASISRTTALPGRRQWLFLLTATTTLKAIELPSRAEDIPLFGLRKKLKKVEEEAEEIIKEGIEVAEKGIKTAERGIETAEKEIETVEKEIETSTSFGGLAQAGVVAGVEVFGVLVATSVVNGILGPEVQEKLLVESGSVNDDTARATCSSNDAGFPEIPNKDVNKKIAALSTLVAWVEDAWEEHMVEVMGGWIEMLNILNSVLLFTNESS